MYRTLAVALVASAAPALGIANFIAGANEHHQRMIDKKRALRRDRDLLVVQIVRRRDAAGRFVKLAPLRDELADVNKQLTTQVTTAQGG